MVGRQFRSVVIDYDGTLTTTGRLDEAVADALDHVRDSGVAVVLATGRIADELLAAEPSIIEHVDLIVAENGAVLWNADGLTDQAPPVTPELAERLRRRGLEVRSGRVLVAAHGHDEVTIVEELRALGEEYQLIRNRTELMVLPSGVSKGSGARIALAELGLSVHNAIGIGDAENDHSLLDACEIGVAVSDSVPSLRRRADIVLEEPGAASLIEFLRGPIVGGRQLVPPSHWRLDIGRDVDGSPATLPASQINILVAGGSGTGKSYAAGMLAEQLIRLDYSVLVIDPEGDHRGLGRIPDVAVTGRDDGLLAPDLLVRLLRPDGGAVVVDLSSTAATDQQAYLRSLWAEVEAHRSITGLPHWIVTDEAQRALPRLGDGQASVETASKGHVLVTWRAAELPGDALASLDAVIVVGRPGGSASVDVAAAVAGVARPAIAAELDTHPDSIIVTRRWQPGSWQRCALPDRVTPHERHAHKYERGRVADEQRFWLWRPPGSAMGERCVAGLGELEVELARCAPEVLAHHGRSHDLSRWIAEVFDATALAGDVASIEATLEGDDPSPVAIQAARVGLLALLQLWSKP